jgi:hypothetical protein
MTKNFKKHLISPLIKKKKIKMKEEKPYDLFYNYQIFKLK